MLAAEPPTASPHLRHSGRKPLQPKPNLFNFINHPQCDPPNSNSINKPKQQIPFSSSSTVDSNSNKENINPNTNMNVQLMDASLAQELTAVKQKMERLKSDKEKTQNLLQQRDRVLEVQMTELLHRGEFQKELEIEVDRLYRLKHLKLACLQKTSPIRSLREKEMEKKNKESQAELIVNEEKTEESKEESVDESSTTESPTMSLESSSASNATESTATSKKLPISSRLNMESDSDDKCQ